MDGKERRPVNGFKASSRQRDTVADLRPQQLEGENIRGVFGEGYQKTLLDYDLIIKSPGIRGWKIKAKRSLAGVTSQTELFLSLFRNQVIGITGTKGKSTTSALTAHIFKESGFPIRCFWGISAFPPLAKWTRSHEDTVIVYELSCHQLEYHESFSPYRRAFDLYGGASRPLRDFRKL